MMTAGTSGRPDLRHIAQRYREVKGEGSADWVAVQQAGAASTLMSRMPGFQQGQQTGRYLSRKRTAQSLHAFATRTMDMSVLERCKAAMQMQSSSVSSIPVAIKFASAAQRHTVALKRRKLNHQKQLVEQYAGQSQEPIGQEVLRLLQFTESKAALLPLAPDVVCLKLKSHIAEQEAARLYHLACKAKTTNLGPCLDQYWSGLHVPVSPSSSDHVDNASRPSLCRILGVCVCSAPGKELLKFKIALHKIMKSQLTSHPETKRLLSEGFIVLCLTAVPNKDADESERNRFVAIEHWMHIGIHYYKPFRSTYHKVYRAPAIHPDYKVGVHDGDRVLLEVVWSC